MQGINSIRLFRRYKQEQLAEVEAERERQRNELEEQRRQLEAERADSRKMMEELLKMKEEFEAKENAAGPTGDTEAEDAHEQDVDGEWSAADIYRAARRAVGVRKKRWKRLCKVHKR